MNNSILKMSNTFRKLVSILTMMAFVMTGFGPSLVSAGHTIESSAISGATVTATPNSGTLSEGQTLQVNITLPGAVDPTDATPFSSPSCLVNGVNVASTFTNLTSGADGHFRFTYTVGASDANRTAGNVPIDCSIQQSHTVHVSAFTDGNTVAINSSGATDTTPPTVTSTSPSDGAVNIALNSTVEVTFSEPMDQSTINSDTFLVSGGSLEAGSITFGGNTAIFTPSSLLAADRVYTGVIETGARDAGGNAIEERYSWTFTTASESSEDAPSLSMVSINPSSGTIHSGDTVTVTFTEQDNQTDLSVTGICKVNGIEVGSSLENMDNGTYTVTYTVGANDGERPSGHIPITCQLGNSAGNTTANAWMDDNTLAIDTNNDGVIDNGTNNLGFTVSASPSSGTVNAGGQIVVSMQDPLPSGDVEIVPEGQTGTGSVTVSNGCKVNNVDVSDSYAYHGNGLYKVTYTVSGSDTDRSAGEVPFDCTLSNHTGTVHLVAFTDSNTVAVNASEEEESPTLVSIAITTPATKLDYTVEQSLDLGGLVVTGTYSDGSTQVQSISTSNVTGFNSSTPANNQVLTITIDGKTTTYTVDIVASDTAIIGVNNSSPSATISSSTQPIHITVSSGTTNPTIDISSLLTDGAGVLPAITITGTNANNVVVTIPEGTTVTSSDTDWNGIFTLPTITTVTLPTISGQTLTLESAIQLGFSGSLTFNKAVRILFPGQAGKKVGYVRSGISFTEITATCGADTQTAGDSLSAGEDCKIDADADLVVWTKHFTTFATYTTQTSTGGGNTGLGGGGGSGGGNTGLGTSSGSGGGGAVNLVFVNQATTPRAILGCDVRTLGFSTITGESCIFNIPNTLTSPINLAVLVGVSGQGQVGQVLGATTFAFTQTLRTGSRGDEVMQLQSFLNKLGYNLVVDGIFGSNTRAAVIQFQRANGLVGDGIVGPITRASLNN